MTKKKIGVGSISFLLVVAALIWSYNLFGFCLGDRILTLLHLPVWSNGGVESIKNGLSIVLFSKSGQGIHYTVYYSLFVLLPALILGIKYKNDLFATLGKWCSAVLIVLLLASPLFLIVSSGS